MTWVTRAARALGSAATLTMLTIGPPVLLAVAGTLPGRIPTVDEAGELLTSPDDGTLLLVALTVAGWALWLWWTCSLVVELVSHFSHRGLPRIRMLAAPQRLAATLLGGLLFLPPATAMAASPATAAPITATVSSATTPTPDSLTAASTKDKGPRHVVGSTGETLWDIAADKLGDGMRHKDLRALNPNVPNTATLPPGTVVLLPADAKPASASDKNTTTKPAEAETKTSSSSTSRQHVVKANETLWGIAEDRLGEGERYDEIYRANTDKISDPDLIHPQQKLTLPSTDGETTPAEKSKPSEETPEQAPKEAPEQEKPVPDDTPPAAESDAQSETDKGEPAPAPTSRDQRSPGTGSNASELPRTEPASSSTEDRTPAVVGIMATGLLSAAVVATLWRRRVIQQRRRRPGQRIAMPDGAAAATERELRAAQRPADAAFLDRVLRTLAASAVKAGRPLPDLELVSLGVGGVTLHLPEPQVPLAPFTAEGEPDDMGAAHRWRCPLGVPDEQLLEAAAARAADAPYPALVVLGWDETEQLLLADLEWIGVLRLTGPGRHLALRTLAVELATSELADDIDVSMNSESAAGLAGFSSRLTECTSPEVMCAAVREHYQEQQDALVDCEVDSLRVARVTNLAAGGWTPHIALVGGDPTPDSLEDLVETVMAPPRAGAAVIATSPGNLTGEGAGWVVNVPEDLTVTLPGSQVQCRLQALSDEEYDAVLQLLRTSDEDDVPVPVNDVPETDFTADEPGPSAASPSWDAASWDSPHDVFSQLAALPDKEPTAAPPGIPAPSDSYDMAHPEHLGVDFAEAPETQDQSQAEQRPPHPRRGDVEVAVLGPVVVEGARGAIPSARTRSATELAAWLVLHPGSDRHELTHALWPGKEVSGQSLNQLASRTRKWLGTSADGEKHFPTVPSTKDARYRLHSVSCDWDRFQELVRQGRGDRGDSGASGTEALRAALSLVRGRPFAGVPPTRYVWAEHLVQEMISAIVDASQLLTERYLIAGDARGALWAATRGLEAAPEAEQLYRDLFKAHAAVGDLNALRRAASHLEALNLELGVDTEDDTLQLLHSLLGASS